VLTADELSDDNNAEVHIYELANEKAGDVITLTLNNITYNTTIAEGYNIDPNDEPIYKFYDAEAAEAAAAAAELEAAE
jgi:hypothetical protein